MIDKINAKIKRLNNKILDETDLGAKWAYENCKKWAEETQRKIKNLYCHCGTLQKKTCCSDCQKIERRFHGGEK